MAGNFEAASLLNKSVRYCAEAFRIPAGLPCDESRPFSSLHRRRAGKRTARRPLLHHGSTTDFPPWVFPSPRAKNRSGCKLPSLTRNREYEVNPTCSDALLRQEGFAAQPLTPHRRHLHGSFDSQYASAPFSGRGYALCTPQHASATANTRSSCCRSSHAPYLLIPCGRTLHLIVRAAMHWLRWPLNNGILTFA